MILLKNKEIKKKNRYFLKNEINLLVHELLNLKTKQLTGNLNDTSIFLKIRKTIARIKTFLSKK